MSEDGTGRVLIRGQGKDSLKSLTPFKAMARPGIQSIGSKTHRGPGRPTKRTPQLEAALLEAVATGAPYAICCASVGISLDCFMDPKRATLGTVLSVAKNCL